MRFSGSIENRAAKEKAIDLAGESRTGLGCMALTGIYGEVERKQAIGTLHTALDYGVTLFDTAPLYGSGANEELLGDVIGSRGGTTIVTKFGLYANAQGELFRDSRPETIRSSVESSLKRLKRDRIDLLLQHRTDSRVRVDEVRVCINDLISEGKVGAFGLSCVTSNDILFWSRDGGLDAVQNELSLNTGSKRREIAIAEEESAIYMAFSPLARGILTGSRASQQGDIRMSMNGFPALRDSFRLQAEKHRATIDLEGGSHARQAIDWVLAQGSNVVAIPGCRTPNHVAEIFR
ncbi:aldo/keto reductase [Thalassococcus profundi]|uniref:Aldo/keto reductase n=1 Tax=Thalassococcus profundi TaxID=2282382 RepID=A0A369TPI6_9RHOB|nr:aldo/keto reductase [Thalassococcus profundi]RDD67188.1 aldo/keto reductase [Thalassococcus profundi]